MERRFDRALSSLEQVFAFVETFITTAQADPGAAFPLNLAIEELFVNMVNYNAGGGDIDITLERERNKLLVTLHDSDSEQYDILRHNAPDVHAALEDREPGGLGIHLVKSLMDEVYYEYRDRQTTIRLVKMLPPNDAES